MAKASLRTAKTRRTAKVLCRTAKGCARERVRISTWSGRSLTHKRISHPHPPSRHPPLSLDTAAPYPAAASLLSRSTPPRPTPPPPPSSIARRRRALPRRRLPPLSHVAAAAGPPTQTLPLASPSLAAASLLPPRQAARTIAAARPSCCCSPPPPPPVLLLLCPSARRPCCCCLPAAARGAACPLCPPPAVGAAAATIRGSSGHHQVDRNGDGQKRQTTVAKNILRYLPVLPRIQRLFMTEDTAQQMRWAVEGNRYTDKMIHPSDGTAWKNFVKKFPLKAGDPRSVAVAISTDGFNPYGPKYPGKNMNVYLEPLVDDLVRGWEGRGIRTYDASKKEYFDMYVWYHMSLHDLPARALFCGWCTHGKWPCPQCRQAVTFFWLNKGDKYSCFDEARQFLERRHAYRSDVKSFKKGRVVRGPKPIPKTGTEIKAELDALQPSPDGNGFLGYGETHHWTHKPCLWKLPYFEFLELSHNIDVMHTEKNISEAIWSTIVDTEPPVAPTGRPRRKNATRVLTPSPSPPPTDDDEEEDQEHHGGGEDQEEEEGGEDQEEEGDEEDLSEDERLGNLVFDPDPSLEWHEPEDYQYVPAVERLRPRDRKPYRRGITQLPALKLALQARCSTALWKEYEDPSQRPPRGYSNILGGLLRWYFPGIVNLPTGGCDVAWRWAHYSLAEDPLGRGTAADLVVAKFWKYFKRAEGKENACDDVLHQLARKRVTGMHYEARVQCVRDWHADRFIHMTKEDARDTLMQPWQYLQNPPQYVGNDDRCFRAMVMWWTCPQYLKKHEEGKKKRAEMRGGSHIQGSIPISLHLQKEEVRTGAKPNVFAVLKKMKQRKTPDPETGSVWVNPQSETQCTSYVSKFKQKYGEDANPEAEDFDPEVAVLAGEGLKHGRLWFGDGCVDPAKVPSLRQIRRGRKSGQPEVEPRPRASDLAVERLWAEMGEKEQAAQEHARNLERQVLEYQQQQAQMMLQMQQQQQMMQQHQAQMSWLMSQTALSSPPGSIPAPPPYSMPWMPPPPTQTPGTPITVNNMNIIRSMNRDYVSQGNDDEAGASNGGGQG
ncbi:hypothetical protein QYE76_026676 [Lolium multiflorum]|uniref:Uncharacterized protein n=1 Tax=Lolium multiflorum TaxID=4521 RepID=A0AAD8RJ71_LOLMU|nr:hypothetical protein QYE76_026676 [Lolium multiflorum]